MAGSGVTFTFNVLLLHIQLSSGDCGSPSFSDMSLRPSALGKGAGRLHAPSDFHVMNETPPPSTYRLLR